MSKGFSLFLRFFFGAMLVVAVLVFSGLIPQPEEPVGDQQISGTVTIWGTFSSNQMSRLIQQYYEQGKVSYVQKDPDSLDDELVEALAAQSGPDLILLPQDLILKRERSLNTIPFEVLSERDYRDTYLDQGEIYLREDGAIALPFYIDPMVMYWNRNAFSQKGLVSPPQYWDEMYDIVPTLTERTDDNSIEQSALSFGEFRNVTHAKDLISMLILQTGNPIIQTTGGRVTSTLGGNREVGLPSAAPVLDFYTNFSDPRQEQYYTWNRGLPESKDYFVNQNLAMYFGYASEYAEIQRLNPLLNFDVSKVPQVREGDFDATIGKIFGVAILAQSDNKQSAYSVALTLAGESFSQELSAQTYLPPVQRALYSDPPSDAFRSTFYDSAIISRGWPDPAPTETDEIYRTAVENITSDVSEPARAVGNMDSKMQRILEQTVSMEAAKTRALEMM